MEMKEFLYEDLVKVNLEACNKKDAIIELSGLLLKKGFISDLEGFIADVYEREREGETNLGQGIAIPHGKSNSVIKTSIAIGKVNSLDWEGPDPSKVDLIILFAVRMVDKTSVHLKLLAEIASKLGNDDVLEKMKEATSSEEMLSVFY